MKTAPDFMSNVGGFTIIDTPGQSADILGYVLGVAHDDPNTVYRHGLHIHEKGNCVDNCDNCGGHYNPFSVNEMHWTLLSVRARSTQKRPTISASFFRRKITAELMTKKDMPEI